MNKKVIILVSAISIAAFLLAGFGIANQSSAQEGNNPALVVTALPTGTSVPTLMPTLVPATNTPSIGMLDLGTLLTPKVTANAVGSIDWDLGAHPWVTGPGLVALEVKYMDTGIEGAELVIDKSDAYTTPEGAVLICGGTDAKIELGNGFVASHGNGFYFVLLPNTQIASLWLKNGFCLFANESEAQQEFAARVAQAISSNWAYGYVYQPEEWPALTGTYSTPLNSNR